MKIILMSSPNPTENVKLFLKENLKQNSTLGVIPADTPFYNFNKSILHKQYKEYGFEKYFLFDVGYDYDSTKIKKLFECEAIILEGGNTPKFLWLLKKRNMLNLLYDYAKNGGILMGYSAGAHILTPSIYLSFMADYNEVGFKTMKEIESIGLTTFLIKPHAQVYNKEKDMTEFYETANYFKKPIVLLNDGQSVIINGDNIIYDGNPTIIEP